MWKFAILESDVWKDKNGKYVSVFLAGQMVSSQNGIVTNR